MPCVTDPEPNSVYSYSKNRAEIPFQIYEHRVTNHEAVLCGVLTVIEKMAGNNPAEFEKFMDNVDWKEVGIDRDTFNNWWKEHKKGDLIRRVVEEKVQEMFDKLTPHGIERSEVVDYIEKKVL